MTTRNVLLSVALGAACVVLVGCAASANPAVGTSNAEGLVAGFWRGLWHGIIAPVALVISWFSRDVSIYEVHNNGGWYNFGFLFGLSMLGGGSHAGPRVARRRVSAVVTIRE